jgi:transcriptional regulator with XRE-family HTH domain
VTIAKRVRDCRYAKGWGPDELASRAEISRTALYQIECGKTETPRAGTLRRIARALDVSIETLLGTDDGRAFEMAHTGRSTSDVGTASGAWANDRRVVEPAFAAYAGLDEPKVMGELSDGARGRSFSPRHLASRDGELQRKFRELLGSPLGEGVARIVEETYRLLPELQFQK